jgi:hypothetical protein
VKTLSDCISDILGYEVPNFMEVSWRSDLQRFLNARGYFFAKIDGIEMHKSIRDPHVGPSMIVETANGFLVEEPDIFHEGMNPVEVGEMFKELIDDPQGRFSLVSEQPTESDSVIAVYMLARPVEYKGN